MAEPIRISTQKFEPESGVEIDGKIWSIKPPGAGTELRLSQAFRGSKLYSSRMGIIEKKIEEETVTEEDLDKYEEYIDKFEKHEKVIFDISTSILRDNTDTNKEVKEWVDKTPTITIEKVFDEIERQSLKREVDGQKDSSGSS